MAVTSTMLELGTYAPPFDLPDYRGKHYALSDFKSAKGLVVAFICNHCPYVRHIRGEFTRFAREYQAQGLAVIAIASNDADTYPEDGPAGMQQEAESAAYTFPYLFDESQSVAKAYHAACTPDFYLFDARQRLFYRGRFDASTPKNHQPVTGADMRAAADALLAGKPAPVEQIPSMGCNIKWKAGNEPAWLNP
jgi:peroxiredoxin